MAACVVGFATARAGIEETCAALATDRAPFNAAPPAFADAYTRDTVRAPVADGISLFVPDLPDQPLVRCGIIDVTRPPFNADPSGERDSTAALNQAVDFARRHMLVTHLPPGTYTVSDTIECAQGRYLRQAGKTRQQTKIGGDRNGPCVMVGRLAGPRPTLRLVADAPGFGDPGKPRYVVHFWARSKDTPTEEQPNIAFGQKFIGIDVDIGPGNAGAVGIRHRGAQGSVIQDVRIDAGHGHAGIEGGLGSGGGIANVEVTGGQIGLDLSETQVVATLTGAVLRGQRRHALVFGTRNALAASGIEIEVPADVKGPAIVVQSPAHSPLNQLVLVDSVIDFQARDPANTAVSSNRSVYLKDVFVRNAASLVSFADGSRLEGNPGGWRHVVEYAGAKPPGTRKRKWTYETTVYVNGENRGYSELVSVSDATAGPPSDLRSRHLWPDGFPSWQSADAVNVRSAPFAAAGDGRADDTKAIQTAIDRHEVVFLPKGYYRITRPLRLKPETKLVGVDSHLAVLVAGRGGAFDDARVPKPLIETADDADAATVLGFFGLYTPSDLPEAFALLWRSGPRSVVRSVIFLRHPDEGPGPENNHPLVLITGNGAGRIYNLFQETMVGQGPGYRTVLVRDTRGLPLRFYALNPEKARGEANMEIRTAANVSIYGMKSEGNYPVLWIRDAKAVDLYGYGGNAAAFETTLAYPPGYARFPPSLFRIQASTDIRLAGLLDGMRETGGADDKIGGRGIAPELWNFLLEVGPDGETLLTEPRFRPVVYLRGYGHR